MGNDEAVTPVFPNSDFWYFLTCIRRLVIYSYFFLQHGRSRRYRNSASINSEIKDGRILRCRCELLLPFPRLDVYPNPDCIELLFSMARQLLLHLLSRGLG
jgi:hypothetical protein